MENLTYSKYSLNRLVLIIRVDFKTLKIDHYQKEKTKLEPIIKKKPYPKFTMCVCITLLLNTT